ncbi:hypothetical protein NQZ68_016871 [Dissostichus eleginoides]|nr:hypothetical protein NQZ68_016871 [Dissostichus eleginoides]
MTYTGPNDIHRSYQQTHPPFSPPSCNNTVTSFTSRTASFVSTAQSPRTQPCTSEQPHKLNLTTEQNNTSAAQQ